MLPRARATANRRTMRRSPVMMMVTLSVAVMVALGFSLTTSATASATGKLNQQLQHRVPTSDGLDQEDSRPVVVEASRRLLQGSRAARAGVASSVSFSSSVSTDPAVHGRSKRGSFITFYGPIFVTKSESHNNRIWNALSSWVQLMPQKNVLLFSDDANSCDWLVANGFAGIKCERGCMHPRVPRQDISCMAEKAVAFAKTPVLCMINTDIILMPDVLQYIRHVFFFMAPELKEPLIVGRRFNIVHDSRLDVRSPKKWSTQILDTVTKEGELFEVWGMDYFIHTKNLWNIIQMPDFVVGVFRWDTYLMSEAVRSPLVDVIDATEAIYAVHMWGKDREIEHSKRPFNEHNNNIALSLQGEELLYVGRTDSADYRLTRDFDLVKNEEDWLQMLCRRYPHHCVSLLRKRGV